MPDSYNDPFPFFFGYLGVFNLDFFVGTETFFEIFSIVSKGPIQHTAPLDRHQL